MKCESCYYYQLAQKWVNTPFKLGGTSLKGIDCFGVSLRIVQESGLISEDQFRVIHTTTALRILRKEGVHKFKAFIQEESGGRLVETTDPTDLKCGDWALRIIGRNFDQSGMNSNESGKSKFVEAVSWILFGDFPGMLNADSVIRKGESKCVGRLKFDNGVEIERIRGKNKSLKFFVTEKILCSTTLRRCKLFCRRVYFYATLL